MRIAFTGAHRVGKTTLAEETAARFPHYELKTEPYLQLEEEGYLFSEIPTTDDYVEQFRFSMAQTGNSANDVIFDRCPLDILAYMYATDRTRNISAYYEEMSAAMQHIDILVFVPVENPDLIMCQESDLPDLRHEVNDILEDWIADFTDKTIEVTGTSAHRKKQVLDKIINWHNGKTMR